MEGAGVGTGLAAQLIDWLFDWVIDLSIYLLRVLLFQELFNYSLIAMKSIIKTISNFAKQDSYGKTVRSHGQQ